MRILIMNEFVKGGGTESQVNAEYDLFRKHGHEVRLITYDATYDGPPLFEGHDNIPFEMCDGISKWRRQMKGESGFGDRLAKAVAEFSPEVIHLNNVFSRPRDVYAAVAPFPVVQTLRDYSVICPRDFCADDTWRECGGYHCVGNSHCTPALKTNLQHRKLAVINGFRSEAVDIFLSCSRRMAEKCADNGMDVSQLRDMLSPARVFKDTPVHRGAFLYYGRLAVQKGVGVLLKAFDFFAQEYHGVHLLLAGSVDPAFEEELRVYADRPWLEYLGYLDLSGLQRAYAKTSFVVVPSLWIENYPNTALEAMANNTVAIGSNRGGIPEMIGRSELLFDVLSVSSVADRLGFVWNMDDDSYDSMVGDLSHAVRVLSSQDVYYEGIMNAFEKAMVKRRRD